MGCSTIPWGGGVLPCISYIGIYRPIGRVGFLRRFDLKNGHTLCPWLCGIGYGFRGNYGSV